MVRRKGFPSETKVKRGLRVVNGGKELFEKLGRNDHCPCGSGRTFQKVLYADWSVEAQYNLGYAYEHGKGIRADVRNALEWYKRAAEQGDAEAKQAVGRLRRHPSNAAA